MAGEPGDRWLGCRKAAGREESPDTVSDKTAASAALTESKGNAPGNARGPARRFAARRITRESEWRRVELGAVRPATESATENRPPAECSAAASSRETWETPSESSLGLARVKRWGKSPPLVWRQARHGKPRVVQGQIGGESRPGSLSALQHALPSRRKLLRRATLG